MMYSSLVIQSARPGSSKMFRMFSKKRKKKYCSSILSFRISLVHGYSVFIHIHLLNNYFNWHVCLSVRFFPFVRKLALAPAVLSQILTDKSYLVVKNPQNPQAQNQYLPGNVYIAGSAIYILEQFWQPNISKSIDPEKSHISLYKALNIDFWKIIKNWKQIWHGKLQKSFRGLSHST